MASIPARRQRPAPGDGLDIAPPFGNGATPSTFEQQSGSPMAEPKLGGGRPQLPTSGGSIVPGGPGDPLTDTASLQLIPHEVDYLRSALDALTTREREVVLAICAGGTNEGIADRLCIALPTLRTHLMRLNQKLGTTSKGDVVRYVAAALIQGYRAGSLQQRA